MVFQQKFKCKGALRFSQMGEGQANEKRSKKLKKHWSQE